MGLKTVLAIFFLIASASSMIAQTETDSIIYDQETEYIHKFPNRITGRLFYVNTSNVITINDRNSDISFKLNPNKQDRIGAAVSFRSITLSYSFSPNFLAENKDNGDSKLFNLNLRTYFGKHWMQTLDIYSEKGFFLENNNVNIPLPDLKSFKIGGATSYILNDDFSFRAIISQDEKQIKSTGSFIPRIVYYYTKLNLKTDTNNDVLNAFDLVFAPSYYYNFIPTNNLFISAGVSAGVGINHSKNKDNNHIEQDENLTSLVTELNFSGSITYDLSNFYIGTHYNYLILNHNSDRTAYINDELPFFQIFVGYRFKASKKLVKKANKLNKKLNLN